MSTTTAEFQFAAAFVSLAVAAAGLLLAVLRGRPTPGGVIPVPQVPGAVLGAGFLAAMAAALLTELGSLGASSTTLGAIRVGAGAAVVLGTLGWRGGQGPAWVLRLGGAALMAAGVAELAAAGSAPVDGLLVTSAVVVATALLAVSRTSVAARVAAGSAATLIAIVLALSVALVSIVTSSLQRVELQSLASRAGVEAAEVAALTATSAQDARFASVDLSGDFATANPDPLIAGGPRAAAAVGARLATLQLLYPVGGFAYVEAGGTLVALTGDLTPAQAVSLADAAGVVPSGCGAGSGGSVAVVGTEAFVAASSPECEAGTGVRLGSVVRAVPVDSAYLAGRRAGDPGASIAVVTPSGVAAAAAGPQPPPSELAALAEGSVSAGPTSRTAGDRIVAVQPVVGAGGRPVAALVVSSGDTTEASTRQRLLRTLFLVATGGTGLALLLATLVGDRITVGIRRLTSAAQRVQAGDTAARAGVGGPDEIGVLGGAFDAMVVSIEEQTVALQQAADDESRLRDRLQAIVAGMGDALVAVDAAGRVTDVNPAALRLTGVTASAARGAAVGTVIDLRSGDGAALLPALLDPSGPVHAAAAELMLAGGTTVPVDVTAGALVGPAGEPAGAVIVLRDLRGEREVERMKTEFLSRIGHELRTPLTGILGYAELLVRYGDGLAPERAGQWHGEIHTSAKRLVRIVEMLEFFAGSGAGRVTLREEPVDVRALVGEVTTSWSERVPSGTTVVRRVARDLPVIRGDHRWLSLAVDELVDNAVKFSPGGGRIEVRATVAGGAAGPRWVEIAVRDRGKGMTPEEMEAAFADFSQGDSSDTRAYGGLGLGLALVQRVVDGQGGSVECASAPGRGSTVTLRLPALPALPA